MNEATVITHHIKLIANSCSPQVEAVNTDGGVKGEGEKEEQNMKAGL